MKKLVLTIMMVAISTSLFGQSRSVEKFRNRYEPDVSLFFYKSTLRMFARLSTQLADMQGLSEEEKEEIPDLGSLIDGIEKVKFFSYERAVDLKDRFSQLQSDVEAEGYESVMTAKVKGSNINILMREKRGNPDGFVVFLDNEEVTALIDLEGVPDLSNLLTLSQYMSANTDSFNLLKGAFD